MAGDYIDPYIVGKILKNKTSRPKISQWSVKIYLIKNFLKYQEGQSEFKSCHINIIYFFIKSLYIEPYVVERRNRFIFKNKITFDAFSLNTAKI